MPEPEGLPGGGLPAGGVADGVFVASSARKVGLSTSTLPTASAAISAIFLALISFCLSLDFFVLCRASMTQRHSL
jgi:hypothetical protein